VASRAAARLLAHRERLDADSQRANSSVARGSSAHTVDKTLPQGYGSGGRSPWRVDPPVCRWASSSLPSDGISTAVGGTAKAIFSVLARIGAPCRAPIADEPAPSKPGGSCSQQKPLAVSNWEQPQAEYDAAATPLPSRLATLVEQLETAD